MAQPNDIEARLLAGGADRDVADVREQIRDFRQATTSSFNAMREDLTDLRQQTHEDMTALRQEMGNGFIEVRGKLDAFAAGQQQVVELLNTVIEQQRDE